MNSNIPGIRRVALRTPTLPPATHTNTWIVGDGPLTVFDPASPWEDQQHLLANEIEARMANGERIERIVLTHHHHDHVGGAVALRDQFSTPRNPIPIVAHAANVDWLPDIHLDQTWAHGQTLQCGGRSITAHHTPGHAPGHLVFVDEDSRAVIAGDMVAGVGTIAIAPHDGNLGQYLQSLEDMRGLDASVLLPAHGDALPHAEAVLSFYIAHRHSRIDQVRDALNKLGTSTALEIAAAVYTELDPRLHPLAAVQVTTTLIWLSEQGRATPLGEHWRIT